MAGVCYSGTKYSFAVIKNTIIIGNNMIYKCVWSSCFKLSVANISSKILTWGEIIINIFYKFKFQIFFLIITFLVGLLYDLNTSLLFGMYGETHKVHIAE